MVVVRAAVLLHFTAANKWDPFVLVGFMRKAHTMLEFTVAR